MEERTKPTLIQNGVFTSDDDCCARSNHLFQCVAAVPDMNNDFFDVLIIELANQDTIAILNPSLRSTRWTG